MRAINYANKIKVIIALCKVFFVLNYSKFKLEAFVNILLLSFFHF